MVNQAHRVYTIPWWMYLVFPKQENGKKRKEGEKTLLSENEPDGYKNIDF